MSETKVAQEKVKVQAAAAGVKEAAEVYRQMRPIPPERRAGPTATTSNSSNG